MAGIGGMTALELRKRTKVRVMGDGSRQFLCGVSAKIDSNGRSYFDIPYSEEAVEYLTKIIPNIEIGEPFIDTTGVKEPTPDTVVSDRAPEVTAPSTDAEDIDMDDLISK